MITLLTLFVKSIILVRPSECVDLRETDFKVPSMQLLGQSSSVASSERLRDGNPTRLIPVRQSSTTREKARRVETILSRLDSRLLPQMRAYIRTDTDKG